MGNDVQLCWAMFVDSDFLVEHDVVVINTVGVTPYTIDIPGSRAGLPALSWS